MAIPDAKSAFGRVVYGAAVAVGLSGMPSSAGAALSVEAPDAYAQRAITETQPAQSVNQQRPGAIDLFAARMAGLNFGPNASLFQAALGESKPAQTSAPNTNTVNKGVIPNMAAAQDIIARALTQQPVKFDASKPVMANVDMNALFRQGQDNRAGARDAQIAIGALKNMVASQLANPLPLIAQPRALQAGVDMAAVVGRGTLGMPSDTGQSANAFVQPAIAASPDTGPRAIMAGQSLQGIAGKLDLAQAQIDKLAFKAAAVAETLDTVSRNGQTLSIADARPGDKIDAVGPNGMARVQTINRPGMGGRA